MSLRIFHVIFIIASIALSLFVAIWAVREYQSTHSLGALALGAVFVLAGIAMVVYGLRWFNRLKDLS
jgi:ABC-type phosphate transport system permease subunit